MINLVVPSVILQTMVQVEWELLFSSVVHGHSFNALLMKVLDAGPTLVLVKDKHGHLFGGFASENWHKNGQFYGVPEVIPATQSLHHGYKLLFMACQSLAAAFECGPQCVVPLCC